MENISDLDILELSYLTGLDNYIYYNLLEDIEDYPIQELRQMLSKYYYKKEKELQEDLKIIKL